MSQIFNPFLSTILLGSFALMLQVHGQDQSGFISIDCGLLGISSYNEAKTGITFISDTDFIDVAESKILSAKNTNYQPYSSVRSFPNGMRSCYKLTVKSGTKYLIRARFFYGNYDGQDKLPQFQLHLGPNFWDSVMFISTLDATIKELIHVALRDYIHVCLVNTGSGIPFISAIELRPLPNQSQSESLALTSRYNTGQMAPNPTVYRYPNDIHDRLWYPYSGNGGTGLSTSSNIDSGPNNGYQLPSDVMRTAATPTDTDSLNLPWSSTDSSTDNNAEFHVYMHFAEVKNLQQNQSRQLNITRNQIPMQQLQAFSPRYLSTNTVFSGGEYTNYSILKAEDSNLSPIINAFEVYKVLRFLVTETNQEDFDPITNIKSTYKIQKNWQGDPCAPPAYLWQGVKCSYNESDSPRIISLNLSGSGLKGEIAPSLSSLTMIQTLDLSNNNIIGSFPDFLSQMPNLRILNLDRNNLTGLVPIQLIEKRNNGSLSLSLSGNPNLSEKVNPESKNNNWVMPVLLSLAGISISLLVVAAICWLCCRSRGTRGPVRGRIFTKSEINKITSNLTSVIGQGGFGTVYRGVLENKNEVAVKILSSSSRQGPTEFQNEVALLMRVHHKNLVTLVGYCDEVGMMALVYEYLASGNLQQHVLTNDVARNVLTWKERLQIVMDAARGLDYLHTCCKPPIIHRDLKGTNILLNEKLQAKVADFGLSKVLATESTSHVSTDPKGTPGYLDPEYYITMQLNKKSDVHSFGIVLLELITGKPAIIKRSSGVQHESYMSISEWVGTKLGTENDDIESIVDSRIQGMYAYSSMQKAIEIAIECVRDTAIQRPEINSVYDELKECLEIEMTCEKLQFRERNGRRLGRRTGMTFHLSSDRQHIAV